MGDLHSKLSGPAEPARPIVLKSLQSLDGQRCVDIFQRSDGTFGFEHYRRDPEAGNAWFAIGNYAGAVFPTQAAALNAALERIPWLSAGANDSAAPSAGP